MTTNTEVLVTEKTRQPSRVVVGHCPECSRVIVIENEYDVWPPATCVCGWADSTGAIANRVRYERDGVVTS